MLVDRLEAVDISTLNEWYKEEKDPKAKVRLLVLILAKEGSTVRAIEEKTKIPKSTVSDWIRIYRWEGRVHDRKRGTGGNSYLIREQIIELKEAVTRKSPRDCGIDQDLWSSKAVWNFIKDNYGRRYHINSISRLLRRIGIRRITPRPRHYKADKAEQTRFKAGFKKTTGIPEERVQGVLRR